MKAFCYDQERIYSDRKQQVHYKGTSSSQHPVFCGPRIDPQGSILGPFIVPADIQWRHKKYMYMQNVMYADDTVLFYSGKDLVDIQKNLENDFKLLCNWFEVNELIISTKAGKTETMVFGTAKKLNKIDNHPLEIKHKDIIYLFKFKILWFWDIQINKISLYLKEWFIFF